MIFQNRGAFGVCPEHSPSLSLKERRCLKVKRIIVVCGFSTPRPPDKGGFCFNRIGDFLMINNTKKALLTLASILYSSAAFSYTPDEIYRLALENKVTELKQLKNIDLPDTSGNTALCRAKEENNQTAYRILLSAGASTNAPCMKKLSGKAGGEEIAAGVLAEEAATTTFLGLGATGWTITGLALLGGAAAAGGGGGGGGSGAPAIPEPTVLYGLKNRTNAENTDNTINLTQNKDYDVYGIFTEYYVYSNSNGSATGTINIVNNGNKNAYGIYSNDSHIYNSSGTGTGNISIINNGKGNAYGLYSKTRDVVNASGNASGYIYIKNTGSGNAYGLYSKEGRATNASFNATAGEIEIINTGSGNGYGIYSKELYLYGAIYGTNSGTGTLYGVYNTAQETQFTADSSGVILVNSGLGKAIGLRGYVSNNGFVGINNVGNGSAIATVSADNEFNSNGGTITMINQSYGTVIGMKGYAHNSNDGNINIINSGPGTAVAIYATHASFNHGNITINNLGNGLAVGIYAPAGISVFNDGTITIKREAEAIGDTVYYPLSAKGGISYGIYAENGASVINNGTINITCSKFNTCQNIVLNGASLINAGVISATSLISTTAVTAFPGATFNIANDISGDLTIASEYVTHGFNMTYTATDLIKAGDASGLNPVSGSALFTASLSANQKDVVLKMKSFDSMTSNKSLAGFLAFNYANGKNEAFFNSLKAASSFTEFNDTLYSLTGKDTFKRLSSDDLSILRSLNFAVNEQIFKQREDDASWTFTGEADIFLLKNDQQSKTQFALLNQKLSDSFSIGYSMSASSITTDDKNQTTKKDELFQFSVPLTYRKDKLKATSSPMIGFANGNYTRTGLDQSYEGNIKRQFAGIMNEARYSFTVSDQLSLEQSIELNALAWRQSGHESEGLFSLIIPADNRLSVESGIGFYVKYNHIFDKTSKFSLTSGITGYHEYAEPYNIKLAVKGMAGSFELYDHQARNRGLASFKLNYEQKDLSAYVHVYQLIESDPHTKIKAGLNLNF